MPVIPYAVAAANPEIPYPINSDKVITKILFLFSNSYLLLKNILTNGYPSKIKNANITMVIERTINMI